MNENLLKTPRTTIRPFDEPSDRFILQSIGSFENTVVVF